MREFCCDTLFPIFWCFGDVSPHVCSYYFSSVLAAEWPPFGKELSTRLTVCSLGTLTVCNLVFPRFGYVGVICVLIAAVPDHCILVVYMLKTY